MIKNIDNSQYIELWMYRCYLQMFCFEKPCWQFEYELLPPFHQLSVVKTGKPMFFSLPFCVLGKLNTVFIANSNTFPNNRNKMLYASMQFQYAMFLQDCVCGLLLDESDPVGRGLLRCCSLWYTRCHPGTVVWHLRSSHFYGCILRFQKNCEYSFFNRPNS